MIGYIFMDGSKLNNREKSYKSYKSYMFFNKSLYTVIFTIGKTYYTIINISNIRLKMI